MAKSKSPSKSRANYKTNGQMEKNKRRKQTRHEKRLERFAKRREDGTYEKSIKRLKYRRAMRIMERVDLGVKVGHLKADLINKAKKVISEYNTIA